MSDEMKIAFMAFSIFLICMMMTVSYHIGNTFAKAERECLRLNLELMEEQIKWRNDKISELTKELERRF